MARCARDAEPGRKLMCEDDPGGDRQVGAEGAGATRLPENRKIDLDIVTILL